MSFTTLTGDLGIWYRLELLTCNLGMESQG